MVYIGYIMQISANKIHISADANHLLTQIIGGYITQARGEQLIKVKIYSNTKKVYFLKILGERSYEDILACWSYKNLTKKL